MLLCFYFIYCPSKQWVNKYRASIKNRNKKPVWFLKTLHYTKQTKILYNYRARKMQHSLPIKVIFHQSHNIFSSDLTFEDESWMFWDYISVPSIRLLRRCHAYHASQRVASEHSKIRIEEGLFSVMFRCCMLLTTVLAC